MLIPSIDLKGGAVVQLVQGERLALRDDDVFGWVARFERYPKVQVIDLDAAMAAGDNLELVQTIAGRLSCRVGGGIRSVVRARLVLEAGAQQVIVGSALFAGGRPHVGFARELAGAVGPERVICAVDSRAGRVVVDGWKTALEITTEDAVRALEPFCSEFLYTNVDREGLMKGADLEAIFAVQRATARRVTAAGGISSRAEIDELERAGIDAVVGMALYTGTLDRP
jgi:phosphoribosylformimino-5-aminoimidazole carboxamide ribotide isomerase